MIKLDNGIVQLDIIENMAIHDLGRAAIPSPTRENHFKHVRLDLVLEILFPCRLPY